MLNLSTDNGVKIENKKKNIKSMAVKGKDTVNFSSVDISCMNTTLLSESCEFSNFF